MRHGVAIGNSYTNEIAGRTFCHFSAQALRQQVITQIAKAKYFSVLIDGSTDKAIIDNEIFMAVWCNIDGADEKIHTHCTYFHVGRPSTVNAAGLFQCLSGALKHLEITEVDAEHCSRLVGIGSDGAASNIATGGLRGLVEDKLNWMYWMWCLAHRLELAMKDALKGTAFDAIDEMLLKLYFLYEKSPKRCRELEGVVSDLKDCVTIDGSKGSRPIRASGSRWLSHKLNAMKRVLSKYGAYTSHLIALSEDCTVKSTDRAKLRGYCRQWTDAKYVLGCAIFIDLLSPSAIFSKTMQSDELDILAALTSLLRAIKETEKLKSLQLSQWPVYSATLKNVQDENGQKVYQCQELKRFNEAVSYFTRHHGEFCSQVTECIRTRMEWSNTEVIRDIISTLAVQGWEKLLDENTSFDFIERLVSKFSIPLEKGQADTGKVKEEFELVVQYAVQFISLATLDYRSAWWRIFHSPYAKDWSNALTLIQLLFSLPASNGKLERVFSEVNIIKTSKRNLLSNESLDDLLMLSIEGPPLKEYCPDTAVDLWWAAKTRRIHQNPRKKYKKRVQAGQSSTESSSDDDEDSDDDLLSAWDEWMGGQTDTAEATDTGCNSD